MRILIIEDSINLANALKRAFEKQHYSVDAAHTGNEGLELGLINEYDLIILDIMLPDIEGWDVCRELRQERIKTPILMLTALDSVHEKIKGLDYGADDYLTKPFDLGELLARARSLMRRQTDTKTTKVFVADLEMDISKRSVVRAGKNIKLSAKEFALLEYFIFNRDKVLTREMISEHVWDMNFDPQSNVIDSFVRFLRQKIDKNFDNPLIHTVRGVGYKLSENE